jgi:hypothetical protein
MILNNSEHSGNPMMSSRRYNVLVVIGEVLLAASN